MSQRYSDPKRETDPYALPDVEVFYVERSTFPPNDEGYHLFPDDGYYYWFCFPGCLPDSEPNGPFATEAEAVADAQSNSESMEDINNG